MSSFHALISSVALLLLLAHTAEAFTGISSFNKKASTITLGPVARNGLSYEEVEIGTGRNIFPGDVVLCYYVGQFQKPGSLLGGGKKITFDETEPGEPAEFVVGKGKVIKGFDIGICGDTSLEIPPMKIGGDRKLVIPAYLAYGEAGAGDSIPPNTDLEFQVSILNSVRQEGLSQGVLFKGIAGLGAFLAFMAGVGFLIVDNVLLKH